MKESDLQGIERELGITLPGAYKRSVLDYPFPGEAGTDFGPLYDSPEAIVLQNLRYRDGYAVAPPWPKHLYCMGGDGAASPYVLDLSGEKPEVVRLDHGDPHDILESCDTFEAWLEELIELHDNPDRPWPPRKKKTLEEELAGKDPRRVAGQVRLQLKRASKNGTGELVAALSLGALAGAGFAVPFVPTWLSVFVLIVAGIGVLSGWLELLEARHLRRKLAAIQRILRD